MRKCWKWLAAEAVVITLAVCTMPASGKGELSGKDLYQLSCAVCHGEAGRGDGPGASLNRPRPRDFGTGQFRLVSTLNHMPTREDVFRVITDGIPGTGMPSWGHLPEAQRWALADTVLELAREGKAKSLLAEARESHAKMSEAEAIKEATDRLRPGKPIVVPPMPPATPERISRGREYYRGICASCHGDNGYGMKDPGWKTAEGEGSATTSGETRSRMGRSTSATWGRTCRRRGTAWLWQRSSRGRAGSPHPS